MGLLDARRDPLPLSLLIAADGVEPNPREPQASKANGHTVRALQADT